MFKYSGYAFSISARNALQAAASFVWSCGSRANAVSTWRAASIWAAWLLVTIRMSRIASSLTASMAALRSSACVYTTSASHGTSMSRTRASSRSRRLKKRGGAASIAWFIAAPRACPHLRA